QVGRRGPGHDTRSRRKREARRVQGSSWPQGRRQRPDTRAAAVSQRREGRNGSAGNSIMAILVDRGDDVTSLLDVSAHRGRNHLTTEALWSATYHRSL